MMNALRQVWRWLLRQRPRPWQMEVAVWVLALLIAAELWLWLTSSPAVVSGAMRDPRTCHAFTSHEAAQAAYRANPQALRHLDADRDGNACERLK